MSTEITTLNELRACATELARDIVTKISQDQKSAATVEQWTNAITFYQRVKKISLNELQAVISFAFTQSSYADKIKTPAYLFECGVFERIKEEIQKNQPKLSHLEILQEKIQNHFIMQGIEIDKDFFCNSRDQREINAIKRIFGDDDYQPHYEETLVPEAVEQTHSYENIIIMAKEYLRKTQTN